MSKPRSLDQLAKILVLLLLVFSIQGCGPDIGSPDPQERIAAVEVEENQERLSRVARDDPEWDVRKAAIDRISDGAVLAEIAILLSTRARSNEELADETVEAAIAAIRSQGALWRIAKDANDPTARMSAVQRVADAAKILSMALSDEDWAARRVAALSLLEDADRARFVEETSDWDLAVSVLEKISNGNELERLVRTVPHWLVRRAAVKGVTGRHVLEEIAREDSDWSVRAAAVARIEDSNTLATIYRTDEHRWVRFNAVTQLADLSLLRRIAEEEKDPQIRVAAIHKLVDPELLRTFLDRERDDVGYAAMAALVDSVPSDSAFWSELFASDFGYEFQMAAVIGSDDPIFLEKAARSSYETEPRTLATKKLNDPDLLLELAVEEGGSSLGFVALSRLIEIADQELLEKIALEDDSIQADFLAREAAISRLTNQDLLERIYREDIYRQNKEAAVKAFTSMERLEKEVRTGEYKWVAGKRIAEIADADLQKRLALDPTWPHRAFNIERLDDPELLKSIALNDPSSSARRAAVGRITNQDVLSEAIRRAEQLEGNEERWVIEAAIPNLTNQELLGELVRSRNDRQAMARISDQRSVFESVEPSQRRTLVPALKDEELLKELATRSSDLRLTALGYIEDDAFLLSRFEKEPWKSTQKRLIAQLSDLDVLLHLLQDSFDRDYRKAAEERIRALREATRFRPDEHWVTPRGEFVERDRAYQSTSRLSTAIGEMEASLKGETERIAEEDRPEQLAELALKGEFDDIRIAAINRIEDQNTIERVATECDFRGVAKVALAKLTDLDALSRVAQHARMSAIRLVAVVKTGQASWTGLIEAASVRDAPESQLGEVLSGISLLPRNNEVAPAVVMACHTYIRRGDESRIPDLIDLLNLYGERPLAEDYLNCGQPDLADGARDWAARNGYMIDSGHGSARARWGSQRR